jgi:hypothetical protein
MGKRGPKPSKIEKVVLSTQIDAETRSALEAAAIKSGRKISGEVAFRLRRSFEEDEKIAERFGGPEVYAILRLVAAAMISAAETAYWHAHEKPARGERPFPRPEIWLTDSDAYAEMVAAVVKVLEVFRPPGMVKFEWKGMGAYFAEIYSRAAASSDGSLPPPSEPMEKSERITRRIAAALGPALRGNAQRNLQSIPTTEEIIDAKKRKTEMVAKKREKSS